MVFDLRIPYSDVDLPPPGCRAFISSADSSTPLPHHRSTTVVCPLPQHDRHLPSVTGDSPPSPRLPFIKLEKQPDQTLAFHQGLNRTRPNPCLSSRFGSQPDKPTPLIHTRPTRSATGYGSAPRNLGLTPPSAPLSPPIFVVPLRWLRLAARPAPLLSQLALLAGKASRVHRIAVTPTKNFHTITAISTKYGSPIRR